MKKILAILLIISTVLSFASCGNVSKPNEGNNGSIIWHDPFTGNGGYSATYAYQTFEEYCTGNFVTDVVVATLVGKGTFGKDHMKYTFEVKEAILGKASEQIEVIVPFLEGQVPFDRTGYLKFNEAYIPAVVGADYLLPLRRSVDLYSTPNEYYTWSYSIAIFLDNMPNSTMYDSPLALHVTGIDTENCTREEFIEYVRELTKNNKTSEEELSTAQSLKEIVKDASAVYHIKTWELAKEVEGDLKHTEIWDCEIKEVLKGELPPKPEDPEDPGLVWIIFFPDTVEEGKEYIVAVDGIDGSQTFFELVTEDSVRSTWEKLIIKGYID